MWICFRSRWWSSVVVDDLFIGQREEKKRFCVFLFLNDEKENFEKSDARKAILWRETCQQCSEVAALNAFIHFVSFSLFSQHSSHLFSVSLLIRSRLPTAMTCHKVMTTAVIAEMKSKYSCAHYDHPEFIYFTSIPRESQHWWVRWGSWRRHSAMSPWNARYYWFSWSR